MPSRLPADVTPEPATLLHYLPDSKVIICTSCHYALQPQAISRHLKDIHHILRSSRRPYLQYISTFDLDPAETVIQSSDTLREFPVPFLPVAEGLRCKYHACSHLCVTEKRMKHHWSVVHQCARRPEPAWEPVPLQTFFSGNSLRYFTKPPRLPALYRIQSSKPILVIQDAGGLLRHFITSTSTTLANGVGTPSKLPSPGLRLGPDPLRSSIDTTLSNPLHAQTVIWQTVIPQLAQESAFLMYGILACSALHLAHLEPSNRQTYHIAAAQYQALAMPPFRAAIASLNGSNCHAVLAFIHLLAIHSFAFEQDDERLLVVDPTSPNVVSDWLAFLRSGCDYVSLVREHVANGPLNALLCEWTKPVDMSETLSTPLVDRLLRVIPGRESKDAWSELECQMYRDAVVKLGYAFLAAEKLGGAFGIWDALRVWPVILDETYLEYVRVLHPGALIVLAHYCSLLRRLEGKWYLEGRAKRLLMQILTRLDTRWHVYVELREDGEEG